MPDSNLARRPKDLFLSQLRKLEPDIRSRMQRIFLDVAPEIPLELSPASFLSSHEVAIVTSKGKCAHHLLAKGPAKHKGVRQSLEAERSVLEGVGPLIRGMNPAARCPTLVAYYPEEGILLEELIEGPSLYSTLFGLRFSKTRNRTARLLQLCGDWLSSLHATTEKEDKENPFEWLIGLFAEPFRRDTLEKYCGKESLQEMECLLHTFHARHRGFKKRLCTIHGDFAPYNILVRADCIYVVDLASCRTGHRYWDVAFFLSFPQALLPWRRLAGALSFPMGAWESEFLRGYFSRQPSFSPLEAVITSFARLQAINNFAMRLETPQTWKWGLYRRIARPSVAGCFRTLGRRELRFLQAAQNLDR